MLILSLILLRKKNICQNIYRLNHFLLVAMRSDTSTNICCILMVKNPMRLNLIYGFLFAFGLLIRFSCTAIDTQYIQLDHMTQVDTQRLMSFDTVTTSENDLLRVVIIHSGLQLMLIEKYRKNNRIQ